MSRTGIDDLPHIFLPRSEERLVVTDEFRKINGFNGLKFKQLLLFNFQMS